MLIYLFFHPCEYESPFIVLINNADILIIFYYCFFGRKNVHQDILVRFVIYHAHAVPLAYIVVDYVFRNAHTKTVIVFLGVCQDRRVYPQRLIQVQNDFLSGCPNFTSCL